MVAEDRSRGNRIFLESLNMANLETALRDLLSETARQVRRVIKDSTITSLKIQPLGQDNSKNIDRGDGSGIKAKEQKQSPEEEEMEASRDLHHAISRVITLRVQRLTR
jgi:hypothetical protein